MQTKQISKGVFYASENHSGILYSPKDKIAMQIEGFRPEIANSPEFQRFVSEKFKNASTDFPKQELFPFSPTRAILFLTSDCNSRCIYCYGDAGKKKVYLPFEPAKAATDFVISNATKNDIGKVSLLYHGGGEPTTNWDVLVRSHDYMKQKCEKDGLEFQSGISTNAVVSKEKMEWVIKNFSTIQVSFDGPPHIQNVQRPLIGGKPSYDIVKPNIELLKKYEKDFSLRATISKEGVSQLSEIVEHLIDLAGNEGRVHVEPVASEWGRCHETGCASPLDSEFRDAFIEMEKTFGKAVTYSGGQLNRVTEYFCKGAGGNFCLTPEQFVSSCFEVSLIDDERHGTFFFGKYNPKSGSFVFDMDKLRFLRERKADKIAECQDCFALYNCAGDCLAKSAAANNGDIFNVSKNRRCDSNRGILFHRLEKALSEGDNPTFDMPFAKLKRSATLEGEIGLAESVLYCMCGDCSDSCHCKDYD